MGFDTVFAEDIVLDEAAFHTAIADFAALSARFDALRKELEEMLSTLKAGFNTPAGTMFLNSCEANLFQPIDAQKIVLEHISESLTQSKQAYESVFREYESLQSAINQVNNG